MNMKTLTQGQEQLRQHSAVNTLLMNTFEALTGMSENPDQISGIFKNEAVLFKRNPHNGYQTTFITENVEMFWGFNQQDWLSENLFWLWHVHCEDLPNLIEDFFQLFKHGHHSYKYRFMHQDGSYHWVYERAQAIRDEEGTVKEVIGYFMDVTDCQNLIWLKSDQMCA